MDEHENTQSDSAKGLHALSEVEFKQLISAGGTMTIKQVNECLKGSYVSQALIETLRIQSRKDRASVHIVASDIHLLAARLAALIMMQASNIRS